MYRRIRDLRHDHDLTQTQLAKILGMSQTGYSKYETGENDIPTEILIRLSQLYNVNIDYLLDQTDRKTRVLKNMLGWLANSESSFLMKRKH